MSFEKWVEKKDSDKEEFAKFCEELNALDDNRTDFYLDEGWRDYAAAAGLGIGSLLGGDASAAEKDIPVKAAPANKISHKFENGVLTIKIPAKNTSLNAVNDVFDLIRRINLTLPRTAAMQNKIFDLDNPTKPIYSQDLARKINSNQGKDLTLNLRFSNLSPTGGQKIGEKKEDNKPEKKVEGEWTDKELGILVRSLNKKYGSKSFVLNEIDPKANFKFVKPIDVISKDYGDKFKDLLKDVDAAVKADKTPEAMDVSKINYNIPILYVDPIIFGINSEGFCNPVIINGKKLSYCVIKPKLDKEKENVALGHELRHTLQDMEGQNVLFGDKLTNKQEKYLFDKDELAVRLGKLKSKFVDLTGKEPSDFDIAWNHFVKNNNLYDYDARQLLFNMTVLDRHKLRTDEDLKDAFKDYLRKTWKKVVKLDKKDDSELA